MQDFSKMKMISKSCSDAEESHSDEEETVIDVNVEISIKNGGVIDSISFHYVGNDNSEDHKNIVMTKKMLMPLIKCVNDLAASITEKGGKVEFQNGDKTCIRRMNVIYRDRMNKYHEITSGSIFNLPIGSKNVIVKFYVLGGSRLYRTEHEKEGQPWYRDKYNNYQEEIITFECGDGVDALFILKGTSLHCYVHKAWDFGRPIENPKRDWEWWGGSVPCLNDRDILI